MRYLGLTDEDRRSILDAIGADSIVALYRDVPEVAVLKTPLVCLVTPAKWKSNNR